jgi:hypothetical protein
MEKAYKLQTLYNEMIKYYEERNSLVLKVLPLVWFYINARWKIVAYKEAKTWLYEKTIQLDWFWYWLFQEDKIDLEKFDKVNKECIWQITPPNDRFLKQDLVRSTHLKLLMEVSDNPLELLFSILK